MRVRLDRLLESKGTLHEGGERSPFRGSEAPNIEAMAASFGFGQETPATPEQRGALLAFLGNLSAREPWSSFCVVWSPRSCTFVLPDGSCVDGTAPPDYDVEDPRDWDDHPFVPVSCWTIHLEGRRFLSLRLLGRDHVEVSTAWRAEIASLEDDGPCGSPHPYDRFRGPDGVFRRPDRFRGVAITDYDETFPTLYGPVQPSGSVVSIVRRWPADVAAACREIAGDGVTDEQLAAAWRAVAWTDDDVNWVGVLRAA